MRLFDCPACGGRLWFGNLACACGAQVVFDPDLHGGAGGYVPLAAAPDAPGRPACANRGVIGCDWAAAPGPDGSGTLCRSCAMTAVAPDPALPDAVAQWAETELAKRRVLQNLGRWGWWSGRDPGPRPIFRMLAEETRHGPAEVIMGHAEGVVTMNLAEADPAERVKRREDLGEPYRTVAGHLRHELAHALHLRLSAAPGFLDAFREMFGDEREDYAAALARHYEQGPPPDWSARFVTEYASAHPHEDWAESAAHLMHLTEIADSFAAAGMSSPEVAAGWDAYAEPDPAALIDRACALGLGLNHVNRAMGLSDIYPFVLSDPAREKLAFVHRWLSAGAPAETPADWAETG